MGNKFNYNEQKWLAILLAVSTGSWGLFNFVQGETKKGILKIIGTFLCGLSLILVIIDVVKICTDKYEVNPDAWF